MQEQHTDQKVINEEKQLVRKLSGIEDNETVTLYDTGWDSRAYSVLHGKYFFKFPRSEKIKQLYAYEIAALEQVSTLESPIKTPTIKWRHPNNMYFGYKGVQGEVLAEVITRLSAIEKQDLGNTLGIFLKQLHSIDTPHARNISLDDEIRQFQKWYQQGLAIVQSSFATSEQNLLEQLVFDIWPKQLIELGRSAAFCHGDLHFPNIMYNHGVLGIIDFGDAGYYDQSKDFIDIEDEILFKSTIKSYGNSNNLFEKIKLRQKTSSIITLLFHAGKQDTDNVKKTVKKIKANLY